MMDTFQFTLQHQKQIHPSMGQEDTIRSDMDSCQRLVGHSPIVLSNNDIGSGIASHEKVGHQEMMRYKKKDKSNTPKEFSDNDSNSSGSSRVDITLYKKVSFNKRRKFSRISLKSGTIPEHFEM